MQKRTEQELFWAGEFGDDYITRNTLSSSAGKAQAFWAHILARMAARPTSVLEMGCNIGINLVALGQLLPDAVLHGVEVNAKAAEEARRNLQYTGRATVTLQSLFDCTETGYDFVFTRGVLIHLNPEMLPLAYEKIHTASSRYVCLCEYYNPTPLGVVYRGHEDRLFKRDFAGEFMDAFPDMSLVDYGFVWHRDPLFPTDDVTWFLMEKRH